MAPHRRVPPANSPNSKGVNSPQSSPSSKQPTAAPPSQGLGMTTEARYQHNLRVLRRRDPTITSIFDQYDHICVYSLDGSKWTKHGYEGSMFLFESNTYPAYGFYVLNRSGSADYIQRIYPEDTLSVVGTILGIKHFHTYSTQRMAAIQDTIGDKPTPDPFSAIYAIPDVSSLTNEAKGEHSMIGLWRHEAGNRESMIDVLKRLHSYIQRNERYPEQFRYGPGHPPPPHRLRAVPRSEASTSDSQTSSCSDSDSAEPSDVDRLFAKLIPTPTHSAHPESHKPLNATVNSLFAKLDGPSNRVAHSAAATPATGITLLDTLFASASANNSQTSLSSPPEPQTVPIHSPTPTVSTTPQVLNQDVISTLLGLPPSRTASAASTTHSSGARSTTTSRDGDNEEDSDSNSSGRPLSRGQPDVNFLAVPTANGRNKLGRVSGDVTPRGIASNGIPIKNRGFPPPSVLEAASSISTVRASSWSKSTTPIVVAPSSKKPLSNRQLVPFEDNSELWPYAPPSLEKDDGEAEDPDIVELDFGETSLLSDPEAFAKVLSKKPKPLNEDVSPRTNGREKGRNRKKSRKDRDAREKEDIEKSWDVPDYCSSFVAAQRAAAEGRRQFLNSPPASPSPPPLSPNDQLHTPPPTQQNGHFIGDFQTPTMGSRQRDSATTAAKGVNGHLPALITPILKGKRTATNGTVLESQLDKELVKGIIIETLREQPRDLVKLERNVFVREVLTLIHTDKGFVDSLYQQYTSKLA